MAQDTRKDPRAKVLSMTVRYKSATVDEFIEHHASDVSRGGIYIKTPSPFPPGTLLKFEIRIADEQAVLSGVGRVVWKREPDSATTESPAGMGVKFIKIDDKSKGVIARLVEKSGGKPSTYDRGSDGNGADVAPTPALAPAAAEKKPPPDLPGGKQEKRASTMLGLGAIGATADTGKAEKAFIEEVKPEPKKDTGGFFPASDGEAEMRPPEERTVMKQAAELLQQALSEAGGSLADVANELKDPPKPEPKPEPVAAQKPEPKPEPKPKAVEAKPEPPPSDRPSPLPAAKPSPKKESVRPKEAAPVSARVEAEEKGGSGKLILLVIAAAAAIAIVVFLLNSNDKDPGAPNGTTSAAIKPTASQAQSAKVTPTETAVVTATATETATAATATASAAPTTEPSTSAKASAKPTTTATTPPATAKPTATTPPTATVKPTATTPPTATVKPTATAKPTATGDIYD